MKLLQILHEDFVNYKKPCMTLMFPYCTFKCNKEAGRIVCQNYDSRDLEILEVSVDEIIESYINNPITEAIVMQGFEPFDSFDELFSLVYKFTEKSHDDIVIYTGYNEDEIQDQVEDLKNIIDDNKLIIKFGRFVPDQEKHFDAVLGVYLSSDNQYAKEFQLN